MEKIYTDAIEIEALAAKLAVKLKPHLKQVSQLKTMAGIVGEGEIDLVFADVNRPFIIPYMKQMVIPMKRLGKGISSDRLRSVVLHESGHLRYTKGNLNESVSEITRLLPAEIKHRDIEYLVNALEDSRIEKKLGDRYPNAVSLLIVDEIDFDKLSTNKPTIQMALALCLYGIRQEELDLFFQNSFISEAVKDILKVLASEIAMIIDSPSLINMLHKLKKSKLLRRYIEFLKDKQKGQKQGQGQQKGQNQSQGQQEGQQQSQGQQKGQNDKQECSGQKQSQEQGQEQGGGDGGKESKQSLEQRVVKAFHQGKTVLEKPEKSSQKQEQEEGNKKVTKVIETFERIGRNYVNGLDQTKIMAGKLAGKQNSNTNKECRSLKADSLIVSRVREKITTVLQELVPDMKRDVKRGSLDIGRIYKFGIKKFNFFKAGDYSLPEARIVLLVDYSSSTNQTVRDMFSGDILSYENIIAYTISEAVRMFSKIKLNITYFNYNPTTTKPFYERVSDESFIHNPSGGTSFTKAFRVADIILEKETCKNKFIIMLTDGDDKLDYKIKNKYFVICICKSKYIDARINILNSNFGNNYEVIDKIDKLPDAVYDGFIKMIRG